MVQRARVLENPKWVGWTTRKQFGHFAKATRLKHNYSKNLNVDRNNFILFESYLERINTRLQASRGATKFFTSIECCSRSKLRTLERNECTNRKTPRLCLIAALGILTPFAFCNKYSQAQINQPPMIVSSASALSNVKSLEAESSMRSRVRRRLQSLQPVLAVGVVLHAATVLTLAAMDKALYSRLLKTEPADVEFAVLKAAWFATAHTLEDQKAPLIAVALLLASRAIPTIWHVASQVGGSGGGSWMMMSMMTAAVFSASQPGALGSALVVGRELREAAGRAVMPPSSRQEVLKSEFERIEEMHDDNIQALHKGHHHCKWKADSYQTTTKEVDHKKNWTNELFSRTVSTALAEANLNPRRAEVLVLDGAAGVTTCKLARSAGVPVTNLVIPNTFTHVVHSLRVDLGVNPGCFLGDVGEYLQVGLLWHRTSEAPAHRGGVSLALNHARGCAGCILQC